MPPSLVEARRREAERLSEQVRTITADVGEADAPSRLIDKRELRGWPCAGRDIRGAVDGSVPGSDEHLERLAG